MVKEAHAGIYYTVIITKAWLSSEELPLDFRVVCHLILDISSGDRSGDAKGHLHGEFKCIGPSLRPG